MDHFRTSRRQAMARAAGSLLALYGGLSNSAPAAEAADALKSSPAGDSLIFDASRYEAQEITVGGQAIKVRAFENIVYVRKPVDANYQLMNIYIPEAYFQGQSVGGFTAQTAPIFLPNQVGGYMPAKPGTARPAAMGPGAGAGPAGSGPRPEGMPPMAAPPGAMGPKRENAIAAALFRGFVVASPGARGRTTRDAQGIYTGKAPAAIVDLKAAVRYLRFNDARMPGDAQKIISNGTSAGGALSALLGASGNHPDYEPYLKALGAADAPDDIFAVSAYCPITNLDHADAAYEWLFGDVHDYRKIEMSMLDYKMQRKEVAGTLSAEQIKVAQDLKLSFPAYLNSLQLRSAQGQLLGLDAKGDGSFKDEVKRLVIASAQKALDAGTDLSKHSWLHIKDGRVTDLDFEPYVRYAGRMKLPPAFDALDLSSGENQLFGTATIDKMHFTAFSTQHNSVANAGQANPQLVKMMNAMSYIGDQQAKTAPRWRIRHGTKDRDTSLAIPTILATRLQNTGSAVDFALPWDRPHSGDYDLDELFAWIAQVSR